MSASARAARRRRRSLLLAAVTALTALTGLVLLGSAAAADRPGGGRTLAGAATVDPAPDQAAADQPSREPAADRGPVELLALIATVCLTGAAAGLAQTFMVQRAYMPYSVERA